MLKIGLTGGIGAGKTTVTNIFASHNIPIIDADIVAREITLPGQPALQEIAALFGEQLLDNNGQLKRKLLRTIIFNHPKKRAQLEAILHPLIRHRMLEQLTTAEHKKAPYCILSIPLLLESGWQHLLDRILVIDLDEASQLKRTMLRDNIDKQSAEAIFNAQASRQERLLVADDIINNSGCFGDLQQQILSLHQKYQQLGNN